MRGLFTFAVLAAVLMHGAAHAQCAKPGALGVSRVMTVDPRVMPVVGSHDYRRTLPLAPGEVVLTFDDGPRPAYTSQVLKALSDECLRATFFVVGRQARAYPQWVRHLRASGHTVGTHSQNHPMARLSPERTAAEIDAGVASVGAALGTQPAPFFRFPGLYRTRHGEEHLRRRGLMAWSVDVDSKDYTRASADTVLRQTLDGLQRRRGGILLMHDIQPKTARILPALIANLKSRGFRVVHVVPRGQGAPEMMARAQATSADVAAGEGFLLIFPEATARARR